MHYFLKVGWFGILLILSLTACKKDQQQNTDAANAAITEMKANTIDAAKAAAAEAERAAKDMTKAAENAGAEAAVPAAESQEK